MRARPSRPVAACALAAALLLAGCEGQVQLFASMAERDANEVLASLGEAGIPARKQPGKEGVSLEVPQSSVARAIAHLNAEGLPRERRSTMGDVFRKEGLISSPLEERARYLWALSQELSETVSQIDGVIRARVHVVLPERSSGVDPAMPSSAAVFVKHRGGMNLEDAVPQIRRLVASSIPGLQPDKVTVVLVPASPRAPNAPAPARTAAAARPAGAGHDAGGNGWLAPLAAAVAGFALVGAAAYAARPWLARWRPGQPARAAADAPGGQA
jgi:type III secretion protein J